MGVCNSLGEIGALSAHVLHDRLVTAGIVGHLQLRLLHIAAVVRCSNNVCSFKDVRCLIS